MQLIRNAVARSAKAIDSWFLEPIDARAYALVRITYALMVLAILIEVWPVRASLFSEDGMSYHRPDLLWYLPLKYARSQAAVTGLMVGVGVAALMMAFGLFTRFAALFLYLWNFAYCAIGYPAESGYDGIARIVGFVLLLAPPARAWALDTRIFGKSAQAASDLRSRAPASTAGQGALVTSPRYALRCLQVQLAILYVCTVWLKAPDSYWRNGELMAYFMMSMYSRLPLAEWAFWGRTSVLLTWGSLLTEALIPLVLFNRRFRRWGFLLGFLLHGGIAITSTIGMFSLSMIPLYASFITGEDVDYLVKSFNWLRQRLGDKQPTNAAPTTDEKTSP